MAITNGDSAIAALAAASASGPYAWVKQTIANLAQGPLYSYWTINGSPAAGDIPTTAATCTSATTGAIPFANPTPPALTYIGYLAQVSPAFASGSIMFDRLSHMGGLSGTETGSQAVNLTVPASRGVLADYTDAEWFIEVYVDLGSSVQNLTVTYVNTASVTHTVTVQIPANTRATRLIKVVPSTAGDVIQSITSCQLGGSTGSVGNFGFTCARKLSQTSCGSPADVDIEDMFGSGFPVVPDDACLWLTVLSTFNGSNASFVTSGYLLLFQG